MQFIDLNAQYRALQPQIDARIAQVLAHGQFISGPEVLEFEQAICAVSGRKHCISCGNGTDALQLLYMAWGIALGDAVFCPDITFVATIEPAVMLGATPVFCDITKDTYTLCPDSLERQIQAVLAEGKLHPRVVVAVDFLGNPSDYVRIEEICNKYNLLLLEDAAQSFGASYRGKRCGAFGAAAVLSFFPAKPLGCYGDGGAVLTDDNALASLLRSLQVHGKGPGGKYANDKVGINSRLDTLQAAVMLPKLEALEKYEIIDRQTVARRYDETFFNRFATPYIAPGCVSAYAQYALLARSREERDAVIARLNAAGIPNMIYYPMPQHKLPVFQALANYGEIFENASDYCARTFSLPFHPYLTKEDQATVINAVLGE